MNSPLYGTDSGTIKLSKSTRFGLFGSVAAKKSAKEVNVVWPGHVLNPIKPYRNKLNELKKSKYAKVVPTVKTCFPM